MSEVTESPVVAEESTEKGSRHLVAWFTVGVAVAAAGLLIGRQLRNRHRFNCQTPYDIYEHAGEKAGEYGVGV